MGEDAIEDRLTRLHNWMQALVLQFPKLDVNIQAMLVLFFHLDSENEKEAEIINMLDEGRINGVWVDPPKKKIAVKAPAALPPSTYEAATLSNSNLSKNSTAEAATLYTSNPTPPPTSSTATKATILSISNPEVPVKVNPPRPPTIPALPLSNLSSEGGENDEHIEENDLSSMAYNTAMQVK